MEDSGSATAKTGWLGHHLLLEDAVGMLVGAVPAYLKNHSQGEYVFDHGWADALNGPVVTIIQNCNVRFPSRLRPGRGCLFPKPWMPRASSRFWPLVSRR